MASDGLSGGRTQTNRKSGWTMMRAQNRIHATGSETADESSDNGGDCLTALSATSGHVCSPWSHGRRDGEEEEQPSGRMSLCRLRDKKQGWPQYGGREAERQRDTGREETLAWCFTFSTLVNITWRAGELRNPSRLTVCKLLTLEKTTQITVNLAKM